MARSYPPASGADQARRRNRAYSVSTIFEMRSGTSTRTKLRSHGRIWINYCTRIDALDFAMPIRRENGQLGMRPLKPR